MVKSGAHREPRAMLKKRPRTAALIVLAAAQYALAEPQLNEQAVKPDATPPNAISNFQAHIAELQRDQGSHAFALAEQWLGLGLVQRSAGDYAGAVDSFSSALHIHRMHLGLHHLNQVPVIDLLIESNRAQRAWPQVDKNFKLLSWVHRREYRDQDEQLVPVLLRHARWHLEAHQLPTRRPPYEHLLAGRDAAEQAHAIVAKVHGDRDLRLVEITYLRAAIAHDIARHMSTWIGDAIFGVRPEAIPSSSMVDSSDLILRQNLIVDSFVTGRVALEDAIEIQRANGDVPGQAYASALLGDWHFLFGRRQTAAKQYADAQRLLGAGSAGTAAALLSRPRALPVFAAAADGARKSTTADSKVDYALARFDVDAKGHARNIEIVETRPPDAEDIARRARKHVAATLFRPRIDGGKAVAVKGIEIRYVFPHSEDERKAEGNML